MARKFVAASSQYLISAHAPVTAAPMTLSAWVNRASSPSAGNLYEILAIQNNGGNNLFDVNLFNDSGTLRLHSYYLQNGTNFVERGQAISLSTGTWAHVASVATNNTTIKTWFNGTGDDGTYGSLVGTPVLSGVNEISVGAQDFNSGTPNSWLLDGSVAEVAIWNVALTSTELSNLARGDSPSIVRPSALVCYAPLLGTASPEPDWLSSTSFTVTGATQDTTNGHPTIAYGVLENPPPPRQWASALAGR